SPKVITGEIKQALASQPYATNIPTTADLILITADRMRRSGCQARRTRSHSCSGKAACWAAAPPDAPHGAAWCGGGWGGRSACAKSVAIAVVVVVVIAVAIELEQVQQIADRRAVDRHVRIRARRDRVGQVVAAAARHRRQVPVVLDELEQGHVIIIRVI